MAVDSGPNKISVAAYVWTNMHPMHILVRLTKKLRNKFTRLNIHEI